MLDSDLFLIYCRNTPLEYCTFNFNFDGPGRDPDVSGGLKSNNILNMPYPFISKLKNQKFAILRMKALKSLEDLPKINKLGKSNSASFVEEKSNIAETSSKNINNSASNSGPSLPISRYGISFCPPFAAELSMVEEVLSIGPTQLDCLEYFLTALDGRSEVKGIELLKKKHIELGVSSKLSTDFGDNEIDQSANQTPHVVAIVPMFEWILIRSNILRQFQVQNFLSGELQPLSDRKLESVNQQLNFGVKEANENHLKKSFVEHKLMKQGQASTNFFSAESKKFYKEGDKLSPQISFQVSLFTYFYSNTLFFITIFVNHMIRHFTYLDAGEKNSPK